MTSRRLDSIQKRVSRVYDGDYGRLVRFLPFFLQDLVIFILDNPFVGVVGIGSILTFIKKYFRKIYSYFTYEYMTTLDISEDHQTYRWIECWFNTRDWGKCYHVQGIFYLLLYHHTGLMQLLLLTSNSTSHYLQWGKNKNIQTKKSVPTILLKNPELSRSIKKCLLQNGF